MKNMFIFRGFNMKKIIFMLPIFAVFGALFFYNIYKKIERYKIKEEYGILMRKESEEYKKKYKNL